MSESEKSVTEAASAAFEGVEGAVGLGVDIVEIARMRRILERTPSFREKVFSEEERSYCESTANPEGAGHRVLARHRQPRRGSAPQREGSPLRGAAWAR